MSVSFFKVIKRYSSTLVALVLVLSCMLIARGTPKKTTQSASPPAETGALLIRSQSNASLPSLSARSAAVIECTSGEIVFAKNEDERLPMASTTKIMTALTVISTCRLSDTVTVPKEACGIEGSSVYLREGECFTVEELLYALMLASANDAATALAIHAKGSVEAFAEEMNRQAEALGLSDTHFTNPHGLNDKDHYTTAKELAIISAHAVKNETFRKICSTKKTVIKRDSKESARLLTNHNKMLSLYDGAFGIKTGFTKISGRCLVSGAEKNGLSFIAVTLNAPDDWNDHKAMLDLSFSLYEKRVLLKKGELSITLPLVGSLQSSVLCTNTEDICVIVPRGLSDIERIVEIKRFEFSPIDKGEQVGRIIFKYKGKIIAQAAILTAFCAEKR
ncbi:MAG: D-alanyl-D-alanine carboxypeptidase [Clostridia bacterium]|nr:D-alanyl-D-alanine carboxypeptidase [Clostridia bacterium]